ncbi:sugar phosphate isomerase/epimerase family protein [Microbacterium limosum]|uniref:Sugar phosphate isomerase/epimerase family protein n=1 Tax=Microbacterium limosum TaxID=3079935 RepID=A0AAU0MG91_9MICO|nr:sugar phosphate isomerase/epimerase family protein [Microbacterium sp. Y20]WOQ69501.1 sugar phosphate isomerase/epimerase family protein [Microbacterium sp. Y20]
MTTDHDAGALDVACHLNVLLADAFSDLVPAALSAVVAAGYRRVVLPPLDPDATDTAHLRDVLAAHDVSPITIAGQAPGADVSSADPQERAAGAAMLRAALDLTVALRGDQMNGVPYGLFGRPAGVTDPAAIERAAVEVGRVADEAADRGVMMTFEVLNRYETSVVNTAAQAMEFVALSGSENLRIHLDTFHMAVEEADLAGAITMAAPKLGHLELGQSGRGMLSTGAVDLEALVRHAFDIGWSGRFGVEAFSRSVLSPFASDMLAIWRSPYLDGVGLAQDAMRVIRRGFASSVEGRRAARLSRVGG